MNSSRKPTREPAWFKLRVVVALVLALTVAACGSSNPLGGGEVSGDLKSIKVGSADFPESKIIAEIYAQALEANGFGVAVSSVSAAAKPTSPQSRITR